MGPEPVPRPQATAPHHQLLSRRQPAPRLVYIPKNALLGEGGRETSTVGTGDDG